MAIGSVSLLTAGEFLCTSLLVSLQNVSHQLLRHLPQFFHSSSTNGRPCGGPYGGGFGAVFKKNAFAREYRISTTAQRGSRNVLTGYTIAYVKPERMDLMFFSSGLTLNTKNDEQQTDQKPISSVSLCFGKKSSHRCSKALRMYQ